MFIKTNIKIYEYLEANYNACINIKNLSIADDVIHSLSVNEMVRTGLRKINTYVSKLFINSKYCFSNKTVKYNSFMEMLYHDVRVNVTSVSNQSLQLLVRVKNYVKEELLKIPHVPILLNSPINSTCLNAMNLDHYCKQFVRHL